MLQGRLCALATAGSCVMHVSQIGSHHPWWLNVLMIVMVAVCLPCAVHI